MVHGYNVDMEQVISRYLPNLTPHVHGLLN